MPTDNIADLKYRYYGGGTDAEVAFLQAARDAGISAASAALSGVALASSVLNQDGAVNPTTTVTTTGTIYASPLVTAAFLRPAGNLWIQVGPQIVGRSVAPGTADLQYVQHSIDNGVTWAPAGFTIATNTYTKDFVFAGFIPALMFGGFGTVFPSTTKIPVGTSVRLRVAYGSSTSGQVFTHLGSQGLAVVGL